MIRSRNDEDRIILKNSLIHFIAVDPIIMLSFGDLGIPVDAIKIVKRNLQSLDKCFFTLA